jgi:hypothetical protein
MRKVIFLVALIMLVSGGNLCAEYWPIGKAELKFERALELAKAKLKEEHSKKKSHISSYPLKNFILVKAVYGTVDKEYNSLYDEPSTKIAGKPAKKKRVWGWTFVFANYKDASISARMHVNNKKVIWLGTST